MSQTICNKIDWLLSGQCSLVFWSSFLFRLVWTRCQPNSDGNEVSVMWTFWLWYTELFNQQFPWLNSWTLALHPFNQVHCRRNRLNKICVYIYIHVCTLCCFFTSSFPFNNLPLTSSSQSRSWSRPGGRGLRGFEPSHRLRLGQHGLVVRRLQKPTGFGQSCRVASVSESCWSFWVWLRLASLLLAVMASNLKRDVLQPSSFLRLVFYGFSSGFPLIHQGKIPCCGSSVRSRRVCRRSPSRSGLLGCAWRVDTGAKTVKLSVINRGDTRKSVPNRPFYSNLVHWYQTQLVRYQTH